MLRCNSTGDLHPLRFGANKITDQALIAAAVNTDTWHRQLGHLGQHIMSVLFYSTAISSNKLGLTVCHACELGCQAWLPFSSSSSHTCTPFELLHCDVWTSPIVSIFEFKYYLIILDDFTHFVWTFLLRKKFDVLSCITHFHAYVHTQFNSMIKSFQCDNGREFDNNSSCQFFAANGIFLLLSCPCISQQNGKSWTWNSHNQWCVA